MCMFCKHFRASECTVTLFLDIFNRARMTNRTFFIIYSEFSYSTQVDSITPGSILVVHKKYVYICTCIPTYLYTNRHTC